MSFIEEYRADVVELTNKYLDKILGEIYSVYGFEKLFIINTYEGEGISYTQIAFSDEDEMITGDAETQSLFNDFMSCAREIEIDDSDREGIAVTLEMLMYNSFGFDWIITAQEVEEGSISYTVHVLESKDLDF